jgi:hypothetical protein
MLQAAMVAFFAVGQAYGMPVGIGVDGAEGILLEV